MSAAIALPNVPRVLRTPDECFAHLPDFPYAPHYTDVGGLRIAHIDEGPRDGPIVLLMHGEPTWSYLYRKMIPVLVAQGLRVIAPDLVGFGRSDKPVRASDYSYFNHVQWMKAWVQANDFQHMSFFGQDWGSLVGLRVVAEMPERFDRGCFFFKFYRGQLILCWLLFKYRSMNIRAHTRKDNNDHRDGE